MKISEIINYRVVSPYLIEEWMSDDLLSGECEGGILFEMANLKPHITDLPPNIVLWTRPEPEKELPHSDYRIKVYKDHKHSATYLVGSDPKIVLNCNVSKKYKLDSYEKNQIEKFIKLFYPLIISFIDEKLSVDDLEVQIQKINRG